MRSNILFYDFYWETATECIFFSVLFQTIFCWYSITLLILIKNIEFNLPKRKKIQKDKQYSSKHISPLVHFFPRIALTRLAQVWDDGAPCRISFISFVSATTPFLECSDMQLWRITEQTFSVRFDLKIQRGRFLLSAFLNSILFPIWCWWAKGRFYIINRTYKSTVDKYCFI